MLHADGELHMAINSSQVDLEAELWAGGFPLKNLVIAVWKAFGSRQNYLQAHLGSKETLPAQADLPCVRLGARCKEQNSQLNLSTALRKWGGELKKEFARSMPVFLIAPEHH